MSSIAFTATKRLYHSASIQDFCTRLEDRARGRSIVVALARKMPRWLEYLGFFGRCIQPIVTERALPWISSADAQHGFLYCDDIFNVGTTVSHFVEHSRELSQITPRVNVYGVRKKYEDAHQQRGFELDDFEVQESLSEDGYRLFETALPVELLTLGKPYDVDFPIIEVDLPEAASAWSESEWHSRLGSIFCSVFNLTVPRQRDAGIFSFSVIDPVIQSGAASRSNEIAAPKIRLYISRQPSGATLRLVPMEIGPASADDLKSGLNLPLQNELLALYMEVAAQSRETKPFPCEPRYALLVYLSSFEFGRQVLPHMLRLIGVERLTDDAVKLPERDITLLFGPRLGSILLQRLKGHLLRPQAEIPDTRNFSVDSTIPFPTTPVKADLCALVVDQLKRDGFANRSLSEIFRESFRIIDFAKQGNNPDLTGEPQRPKYDRLRDGLPLRDLWWVALNVLPSETRRPSLHEMSVLLDFFIDLGAVVPIIEERNGQFFRSYRRGEADPIEFAELIRGLLLKYEECFPGGALPKTVFTKILAALRVYHPGSVPMEISFDVRGVVPTITSRIDGADLRLDAVSFLQSNDFIDVAKQAPELGQRQRALFDDVGGK
jgi:hypothetical protein